MYKCVIFDLDGTLIDTIKDLGVSCNYALSKNNCLTFEIEDYYSFVGNGIKMLCKRALLKQNIEDEILLEKVFNDFKDYYSLHYSDCSLPYKSIKEVINLLKKNNILIGVYSNKEVSLVNKIINKFFNIDDFVFVLGENIGYHRKPDPKQLLDNLNKYNLKLDDCIYVGDSEVDYLTAKNANIRSIGVTWGFKNKDFLLNYQFDYLIDNPLEILKILSIK